MKVEQVQTAFEPVTIVLENKEEIMQLRVLLSHGKNHTNFRGPAWGLAHSLLSKLTGVVK